MSSHAESSESTVTRATPDQPTRCSPRGDAISWTIVATALPTVVADLGGAGHQSWVVTSYLLASTIVTAVVGKLGDLFGRKTVFQVAIVFFLAGSVLCGLAGSMTMLVASRACRASAAARSWSPRWRSSAR